MTGKTHGFGFAAQLIVLLFSLFLLASFSWAGEDIEVNVESSNGVPLSNLNVYAFTESGSYTGVNATTDEDGTAIFNTDSFDAGTYKFRVDYLGNQFWSQVITLPDTLSVDVIIEEETAEVTVTASSGPSQGVKVYLFSGTGSYLGLYETTDEYGKVSFDLPVDRDFKFRADILGSQYWSDIVTIVSGGINDVSVDADGGTLYVTVDKGAGIPMEGINTYLFNTAGSYLGRSQASNASGMVEYDVPQGDYKVRADYLGNQFWSQDTPVTEDTEITISIPHQEVVITVEGTYQTIPDPIEGINVYLFSSSGSYMGQYEVTDGSGQVTFNLPDESYKVRADYLGQQFWSDDFTWQDTTVDIPMADAEITVTGAGLPLEDVNVYVFSESGSYLGVYGTTDVDGMVTFRLPAGTYNFRADYQGSQYWSDTETLTADQTNPIDISTGGGIFTLTVFKGVDDPLTGVNCYLFSESGSYLGLYDTTDTNGQVSFSLADGTFKIRVDYLGNQFWTDVYEIPTILSDDFTIPHQDVVITIQGAYQGAEDPLEGINVYLFSSSGSYMGQYEVTDGSGQVTFNLPEQTYKVRADYMGQQFWSGDFTWQDTTVTIQQGIAQIHVFRGDTDVAGASVYLFSEAGSYLGRYETSDTSGMVQFLVPSGPYKFRANEGSDQRWSDVVTIIADQVNSLELNFISNTPPSITIIEPDGIDDIADNSFTIQWTDDDPDDDATIFLYYDTDDTGADGILIVNGLSEDSDDAGDEYNWDTSEIPDGDYYIYAVIDDGINAPLLDYSDGVVSINHVLYDEFRITADDMEGGAYFGHAVSVSGDYVIVGAFNDDDTGSAYIFERDGLTWTQQAKIKASDAQSSAAFGRVVSICGDYAIVGARAHDSSTDSYAGAAYIFKREGSDWIEQAKLTASDQQEHAYFGQSVSINGDYAIVGAVGNDAAYIFKRDGSTWIEQAKIQAADPGEYDRFGNSVAISGDYAIVGADSHDSYRGAAYIFRRFGSEWIQQAKLMAGDAEPNIYFGCSVSIDGGYAMVGANHQDFYGTSPGTAYIFRFDGSGWVEEAKLTASDGTAADHFGGSVSINGSYAIVGSNGAGYFGTSASGSYIFKREGSVWTEQAKIPGKDLDSSGYFQSFVDLDGVYAVVGSPYAYIDGNYNAGAAYIYTISHVNINSNQAIIQNGASATLTWSSVDATSVEIDNGIGEVASEGSVIVSPAETTTYTITATGTWGTEVSTVTVYVINPPTVILSADESSVMIGDSVNLTWDSSDADTCVIEPDIGAVDPSGSIEIVIYEDITYTITATNIVGLATDTVEITAVSALEDTNFGIGMDEQQGGGGLVGETVNVLNGNVVEYRSDVRFSSPNRLGLPLIATYNSKSDISGPMGHGWSHTYSPSLDPSFGINGLIFLKIIDDTGRAHYFIEETTGEYTGVFGEHSSVKAESGEYVWYLLDGSEYGFSSVGLLAWIYDAIGNRLDLAYDVNDSLQTVTDNASGRTITFHYNVDNLIEYVTGPITEAVSDGTWVSYGYDTDQNLTSVTYADGSGFNYTYEDANDIHNLTGKTNKADHLINTWGYDTDDRAISNFSRDGRGVDIVYESDTQVNVTDAYGKLREYYISEIRGRKRIDTITGSPGGAGAFPYSSDNIVSWIYDDEVRPIEVESAAGTINQYLDYDERGNPGTVILAYDTTEERIIYYTYHPDMDSPLTMTELSVLVSGDKETIWDYDDDYDSIPNESPTSLVSQIIEKGFTMDETGAVVSYEYITQFTYNSEGQVLSIDGPLPGTDDTTSFDYDPATGDLLSITRSVIGATAFSGYDEAGQVGSVTDVNGQSKSFTYDGRGRITVITNNADGSTIESPYNIAGLPVSSTDEDIITTGFEYDSVYGRLDIRTDSEGNYIDYDYDSQGNITEQGYYDAEDTLTNRKRFLYQHANHDMPGLLYREINPDDSYTQYGYDLEGNVSSVKDPNGNYTYYEYDPLNRLESVTQPGSIVTTYDYDLHGNLVSVMDAENNETTYQYDDMGRLVSTTSPDTGTVTYIYDEAGNPVSKTDEKDIIVSYLYDDLNRLTGVNFPDSTENITYSYDGGTNGIGRRTGMTDQSGSTSFVYDYRGLLKDRVSTINGIEYTTSQSYTLAGRITSIAYPSGRSVDYSRTECVCGIDGVSTTYDGNTVTLMGDLSYRPFGVATNMATGAGGTVNNHFNSSGRLEVANPGEQTERSYGYDANGNITSFQVTEEPWKDRTYVYDALNRLEAATGKYGTVSYTYDDVGNRLTKTSNGVTDNYSYYTGTNILKEVEKDTETITYTYDSNGNITGIGDKILTYNQNNRLVMVEDGSGVLGEYTYNGLGQRVIKTANGSTIVFHYDFDGNIIGESDDSGNFTKEYLYQGDSRLAMVDVGTGEVYFYMNDHLGTPQAITNEAGESVWEALYQPFGEAYVHPMSTVENNFRFPGQYYDEETGLHYNYFRYYDPKTGRYLTPDPIGLDEGINLFGYANNNPINYLDTLGLSKDEVIVKGSYRFVRYAGDTMHGGSHWHVYSRRTGKLLGRVSSQGRILTGSIPKAALKHLVKVGGITLTAVMIVLEASDAEAMTRTDWFVLQYIEGKMTLEELEKNLKEMGYYCNYFPHSAECNPCESTK